MATPNSKLPAAPTVDQHLVLSDRARELEQRYPGVRCKVEFSEYAPGKHIEGHAHWIVTFFADSLECLVKHGLATAEQFEITASLPVAKADRHPSMWDGFGNSIRVWKNLEAKSWEVRTYVDDYQNRERELTKKLEVQTARLLRPFVRGTWKPKATRDDPAAI
jgi:hypothetical protein